MSSKLPEIRQINPPPFKFGSRRHPKILLSRKLRFGWLDVLVLAVVFGLIGYVLHRAQSHFHYDWGWWLIPGYSARDLLLRRAEIGMNYLARGATGDRQKALELLNLALQYAQRLKLPEAGQIAEIIRQVQKPPDSLSSPDRQASDGD